MKEVPTTVPPDVMSKAHLHADPNRPVVFVRYYPQHRYWISFDARPPLAQDDANTGQSATVTDGRTGRTFTAPEAHAALLQQVFQAGQGITFRTDELAGLEQCASVVRVVHVLHAGQPGQPTAHAHTVQPHSPAHHTSTRSGAQRLTYTTIPTPAGERYWTIRWHLAHASAKGGWIVQHIVMNLTIIPGNTAHMNYWEAWRVPKGSASTIYLHQFPYDDMFRAPAGTHTVGTARFYEGLRLPPSFVPNNGATAAGILPATTTNPKLSTSNATSAVTRDWRAPQ